MAADGDVRVPPADLPFDVGNAWNITRTMANSTVCFTGFARFSAQLRKSELSPRLREVVILRVGVLLGCDYEWGRHVHRARAAGLTDDDIRAIRSGELHMLDEVEALVARYADAVEARSVTDILWAEVQSRFDVAEAVELTTFAAFYSFVCRFLLALNVPLDNDIHGFEVP